MTRSQHEELRVDDEHEPSLAKECSMLYGMVSYDTSGIQKSMMDSTFPPSRDRETCSYVLSLPGGSDAGLSVCRIS